MVMALKVTISVWLFFFFAWTVAIGAMEEDAWGEAAKHAAGASTYLVSLGWLGIGLIWWVAG